MRVRDEKFIEHTGTMHPLKVQEMEFDQNSIAHLMSVLTDLYSDQALAVIREYSTNGLDSHKAAGNSEPIEVELPSQLKPVFVVRDHGIGMSVDDITDHFSKYGASSKRDNDDEVGMLGLGCKSGLTYTNQFTLTAVKNGVKTTALVTRNPEGKGVIQILDTIGTNERNGVEVQIPVKAPINAFIEKAMKFFKFWEPGTVLVNSTQPESHFDGENLNNLFIDPDIIVVKTDLHTDYVVMGNVAYPCDINHGFRCKVIARVPIGEVNFVPSREQLQMTSRTVAALAEIKQFVQDRLELHIQREIDQCPSKAEAIKVSVLWDAIIHNYRKRPNYRGLQIPKSLEMVGQSWNVGFYRGAASNQSYLQVESLVKDNVKVMLGHPPRSMTKQTKEAIVAAFPGVRHVYIVHQMKREFRQWLDAGDCFQFDDVKPEPQARIKGARNGNWRYADGGGRWLAWQAGCKFETVDIPADTDRRVVYMTKSEAGHGANTRDEYRKKMGEYLASLKVGAGAAEGVGAHTPFYLILIASTEKDRFLKALPGAVHTNDFFQQHVDALRAQLTDDQFWWGHDRRDWRLQLTDHKILDPVATALYARMQAAKTPEAVKINDELFRTVAYSGPISGNYVMLGGTRVNQSGLAELRNNSKSTLKKEMDEDDRRYPLADSHKLMETIEYMNATYLYRKGACK